MFLSTPLVLPTSTPVVHTLKSGTDFYGLSCTSAESAAFYIKLWWQGNSNTAPILGTTNPNLVIPVGTAGTFILTDKPVIMQGPLFWSATAAGALLDATALTTGGEILTFFLE